MGVVKTAFFRTVISSTRNYNTLCQRSKNYARITNSIKPSTQKSQPRLQQKFLLADKNASPFVWEGSSAGFLQLPGMNLGSKHKSYAERRLLGYSMEQMFQVVAEVERYDNFVPWCKKSVVTSKSPTHLRADLVIGFPPLVESYTSSVTLARPTMIKSVCTEGKLFNHLLTVWKFGPGLRDNQRTCMLDFSVSFEFRSILHSQLAHMFFDQVVKQMVNAFLKEAERRFGKASIASQKAHVISPQ